MKIIFSKHAKERLKSRNISQSKILSVLKIPDKKVFSFKNRFLYQKRFGDKTLEIVAIIENKELVIITAYYL